jgi:catechol 2,3-dioxygenase-like lactoylglutathione lyase family enzyme
LFGGGVALQPPANVPAWPQLNARRIPGAAPAWRCRPRGTLISGQVFEDNGAGDKALDGWRQAGEAGRAGWTVRVRDEQGNGHARTRTNGAGHFALKLPPELKGRPLELEVMLPEAWHAVAATEQDLPIAPLRHAGDARWRFTAHPDVQYDGVRLGVVRAPELRAPERRRIRPGSTQLFPFRYTPHTPGRVRFHYAGNLRAETQWKHAFFLDPDCDGESEYVDHDTTRWVDNQPGRPICVRVRVEVPEAARGGVLDIDLSAETRVPDNPLGFEMPALETGMQVELAP